MQVESRIVPLDPYIRSSPAHPVRIPSADPHRPASCGETPKPIPQSAPTSFAHRGNKPVAIELNHTQPGAPQTNPVNSRPSVSRPVFAGNQTVHRETPGRRIHLSNLRIDLPARPFRRRRTRRARFGNVTFSLRRKTRRNSLNNEHRLSDRGGRSIEYESTFVLISAQGNSTSRIEQYIHARSFRPAPWTRTSATDVAESFWAVPESCFRCV